MNVDLCVKIIQSFFYLISITAAIFAYKNVRKQLLQSKQIAKVQFLSDLQREWQNSHSDLASKFLEAGIFSNNQSHNKAERNNEHFNIRNYLHFFELIAIAVKNDAVDLYQVDDLFGHRFWRLYSNGWVKEKILKNPEYYDGYKMLRELSEEWKMHRKSLKRPTNYSAGHPSKKLKRGKV